jgi:hypothetical protein
MAVTITSVCRLRFAREVDRNRFGDTRKRLLKLEPLGETVYSGNSSLRNHEALSCRVRPRKDQLATKPAAFETRHRHHAMCVLHPVGVFGIKHTFAESCAATTHGLCQMSVALPQSRR